jgi:two-component system chemotaxis response regulator CheB
LILWLVALFFESCRVLVTRGPKENRNCPSVDALFRSAAYNHGSKVIGIVLSGALVDGTSGLWSIKRMGARDHRPGFWEARQ